MSIFQTNMIFLSENYPEVFNAVNEVFDNVGQHQYLSCLTKNDEPNLEIQVEGKSFFLHSKYNAKAEAEKWVQSIHHKLDKTKHLLIFGIGLGSFLEQLLLATSAKDIYIYEPDINIFKQFIIIKDVTQLLSDKRIRLLAIGDTESTQYKIGIFLARNISDAIVSVSPPIYERLFPEVVSSFDSKTREMILNEISTLQTLKTHQGEWLLNILHNVPHIPMSTSLSKLEKVWGGQDVTAVIVGSGPSLKEDIHHLRKLHDKCLIIAAGSSIQAMIHYGIYPHIIISLDGSEAYYNVFQNINVSQVPLLFCTQTYRKVVDSYQRDKFALRISNDCITDFFNTKEIPSFFETPTVTGTAMQIAAYMGISKVILMGQDLSFPDDQFYAPGVNHISEEQKESSITQSDIKVKNVNGGENRTSQAMLVLQKSVEMTARVLQSNGVKVINTSKNGAALEEVDWISMDTLIEQLKQEPSQDFNISRFSDVQNEQELIGSLEKLNHRFQEIQIALHKMNQRVPKMIKTLENLEDAVRKKNINVVNKVLLDVNKLWDWITRQDIFNVFYKFSLEHNINVYQRYVPEIVETTDLINKSKLIINHLGALIRQIDEYNLILASSLESGKNNLEEIIASKKLS
ncbi:DUF115 domain-containing protein [Paenibacillus motobuensis]|uniref:motility associated factor glycosyltransferase family protein n=1 Tax=Paenibacillus TaxID=44249 RepID=UPI00203B4658|nr:MULTISPECIES: 6-hydroxymethylpterin diphosphokinase MptE-like protein [Paenibacillus]MCM3040931.1 DUF115 domain-containing protein [Paenibacillus lutimineralis]MCM3648035.1 DUF115 domain-containing protein [Paenibacillus motobuensis]